MALYDRFEGDAIVSLGAMAKNTTIKRLAPTEATCTPATPPTFGTCSVVGYNPPRRTPRRAVSVPADAVRPICQHLRRRRGVKLADALTIARNPPFVLLEREIEGGLARIRDELAALGVSFRTELVERCANSNYGPIQTHRLLHQPDPNFGESKREWVVLDGTLAQSEEPQALSQALICQHCHARGTLVSDVEETAACPSCKERQLLVQSEWIT